MGPKRWRVEREDVASALKRKRNSYRPRLAAGWRSLRMELGRFRNPPRLGGYRAVRDLWGEDRRNRDGGGGGGRRKRDLPGLLRTGIDACRVSRLDLCLQWQYLRRRSGCSFQSRSR
jgi:hypothetical protein